MAKLSKDNWIIAALDLLSSRESSGVSIVKLSKILGVSRGSFYYHFNSLNDLIDAMIARWEESVIDKGFVSSRMSASNPDEEIRNLIEFVTHLSDKQDLMFRQWAAFNDHVRQHMERLDQQRLSFMTEMFQRLAKDESRGAAYAKIAFYGYIGCLNSYPRPNSEKQREVALEILSLFQTDLKLRQ